MRELEANLGIVSENVTDKGPYNGNLMKSLKKTTLDELPEAKHAKSLVRKLNEERRVREA